MKIKNNGFYRKGKGLNYLFILIFLVQGLASFGQQSSVRLLGGFGSQDYFHYGVNLQISKWNSIEFSKGRIYYDPQDQDSDNSIFFKTISFNSYVFLDRSDKHKDVPTWFTKQHYTIWTDLETYEEEEYHFVGLQIGRYMNWGKNIGSAISAGAMKRIKQPTPSNSTLSRGQSDLGIEILVQFQLFIRMIRF